MQGHPPPLASDGGLNRVICTHCLQKETSQEAGPPSEETSDSSDETSDSNDADTSEDSQEEDTEDSNYAEGKKTRQPPTKQYTRTVKGSNTPRKKQKDTEIDPTSREERRLTRATIPGRADGGPITPARRNDLRQNATKRTLSNDTLTLRTTRTTKEKTSGGR